MMNFAGSVVLRAPGIATNRLPEFVTNFTLAFALSLSIPRQEVVSLTVVDGCPVIMTAAGQTDANDCITVQFALAADHEVAVSLLQTATYPDALVALLQANGYPAIGSYGAGTTTVSVAALRTAVVFVVLCPTAAEAVLVESRLADLTALPWGAGVTVSSSTAAEIITDVNAELLPPRPTPPPPPPPPPPAPRAPTTCTGFDCSGHANTLDSTPGGINCAVAACTKTECCTQPVSAGPATTPAPPPASTQPPPPSTPPPPPPAPVTAAAAPAGSGGLRTAAAGLAVLLSAVACAAV